MKTSATASIRSTCRAYLHIPRIAIGRRAGYDEEGKAILSSLFSVFLYALSFCPRCETVSASDSAVNVNEDCEDIINPESWCLVMEEDWGEGEIVPIARGGMRMEDEAESLGDEELLTPAEDELGDSGYIV